MNDEDNRDNVSLNWQRANLLGQEQILWSYGSYIITNLRLIITKQRKSARSLFGGELKNIVVEKLKENTESSTSYGNIGVKTDVYDNENKYIYKPLRLKNIPEVEKVAAMLHSLSINAQKDDDSFRAKVLAKEDSILGEAYRSLAKVEKSLESAERSIEN